MNPRLMHNLRFNRFTVALLAITLAVCGIFATLAKGAAAVSFIAYAKLTEGSPWEVKYAFGANTLTGLIPTLYEALDVISRELVGFIPAVSRDANVERAAVGQVVRSPITPASVAEDITPGVNAPNDGDQTILYTDMTITKARAVPVRWNGEEQLAVNNNGVTYNRLLRDQFVQGMRTLTNEIEVDLANAAYKGASRAVGTAGTAPFASGVGDSAKVLKVLKDNGAPTSNLRMVVNTSAGLNLRSNLQLTKANEAGSDDTLRRGTILNMHGFAFGETAGLVQPATIGTGTGYLVNGALAKGATAIVIDTGSGTILAGDIVTFNGDSNLYVAAANATTTLLTLASPGLQKAVADNVAITVGAASSPNVGFDGNSILLAARAPALPKEGDSASDRLTLVDPLSGLSFEISLYKQYRQIRYELAMAWGVKALKSDFIVNLLG